VNLLAQVWLLITSPICVTTTLHPLPIVTEPTLGAGTLAAQLTVTAAGHVITTVGGAATVNVAVQVVVNGAQLLVYVNVTVVEPPQAGGAPVLLFVSTPLQPPLADAVASHVAKAVFTAACV
jgi:hypothetical protein